MSVNRVGVGGLKREIKRVIKRETKREIERSEKIKRTGWYRMRARK
jgi:hypothetical protein